MDKYTATSPQRIAARILGLTYLFVDATFAISAFLITSRLIVNDDGAATSVNILRHEKLFRLGISADLITFAADVVLLVALYMLLEKVNRELALLAACFRVIQVSICVVGVLHSFDVLELLGSGGLSKSFQSQSFRALMMLAISARDGDSQIGALFVGFGTLIFLYLFFKSRYIPRA
jgi:uncharacterized membrane protein (GlpM family)